MPQRLDASTAAEQFFPAGVLSTTGARWCRRGVDGWTGGPVVLGATGLGPVGLGPVAARCGAHGESGGEGWVWIPYGSRCGRGSLGFAQHRKIDAQNRRHSRCVVWKAPGSRMALTARGEPVVLTRDVLSFASLDLLVADLMTLISRKFKGATSSGLHEAKQKISTVDRNPIERR